MKNRFEERLGRLRTELSARDLDGFYICGEPNVAYFTGHKGNDCFLYVTQQDAYIITDFRYREMAQRFTWLQYYEQYSGKTVYDLLNSRPEKKIGVEKDRINYAQVLAFQEKCDHQFLAPPVDRLQYFAAFYSYYGVHLNNTNRRVFFKLFFKVFKSVIDLSCRTDLPAVFFFGQNRRIEPAV